LMFWAATFAFVLMAHRTFLYCSYTRIKKILWAESRRNIFQFPHHLVTWIMQYGYCKLTDVLSSSELWSIQIIFRIVSKISSHVHVLFTREAYLFILESWYSIYMLRHINSQPCGCSITYAYKMFKR